MLSRSRTNLIEEIIRADTTSQNTDGYEEGVLDLVTTEEEDGPGVVEEEVQGENGKLRGDGFGFAVLEQQVKGIADLQVQDGPDDREDPLRRLEPIQLIKFRRIHNWFSTWACGVACTTCRHSQIRRRDQRWQPT